MSDFAAYMNAQEKTRTARAERDYAGVKLGNARIFERLAMIKSQHEPLHEKSGGDRAVRAAMIAVAFFVVVGRWPEDHEGGE